MLFDEHGIIGKSSWVPHQNEAEKILPSVRKLLQKYTYDVSSLSLICVVRGPHKFTSTRVGITVANTLATLLSIPVIGIDRFDIWQHRLRNNITPPLQISLQSERGDFYTARYNRSGEKDEITILSDVQHRKQDNDNVLVISSQDKVLGSFYARSVLSYPEGILRCIRNCKASDRLIDPLYIREANITQRKKR